MGSITKCEWCGSYSRSPCQCPADVEITRLREALNIAGGALHRIPAHSIDDDDDRASAVHAKEVGIAAVKHALGQK